MMRLLFVCSENRLRSPTAEAVFSEYEGIEAIGAGTNADADTPLSGDLFEQADMVLVMEKAHRNKVSRKYSELSGYLPMHAAGTYPAVEDKSFEIRSSINTVGRH